MPDRRTGRPNLQYEGPDRRFDGTLSPADRFRRIERRQDEQDEVLESIQKQLNRIFGALALIGLAMPVIIFVLNRLFPQS